MTNLKKSLILLVAFGGISSLYSSTIDSNGQYSGGPKTFPTAPKMIGGQGGVYHGPKLVFPLFNSLEITGSKGEVGVFYPVLQLAFLQDQEGNATYFINVTPKAPASDVAAAYTQNFATTTVNGKAIVLHAVALTPELTARIKAYYKMLIGTIPGIAVNAPTLQNKTVGELWEMVLPFIGTWFPKPVYTA